MSETPDAAAMAAVTERDQMIARLWNRLCGFRASADPALVTGPDAAQEIAWAQGLTPRGQDVQAVARAIAVAWLRYLILPAGRGPGGARLGGRPGLTGIFSVPGVDAELPACLVRRDH
jgi:hypothetical protein